MEIDSTANENEIREAQSRINRDHLRQVEDDEEGRDVVWPLEQVSLICSIYTMLTSRRSMVNPPQPCSTPRK